jgi:hypothetical protein
LTEFRIKNQGTRSATGGNILKIKNPKYIRWLALLSHLENPYAQGTEMTRTPILARPPIIRLLSINDQIGLLPPSIPKKISL